MSRKVETRAVRSYCTCEGAFGCAVHDPTLDGLTSIEGLPPDLMLKVVQLSNTVTSLRQQCNGEVYAVDCGIFDELRDALEALAKARQS